MASPSIASDDIVLPDYSKKLSIWTGVILIIFDLGMLACGISEFVIGDLTARGFGLGAAFFNLAVCGFSISAGRTASLKAITNLYVSCIFCAFFSVGFFIGQMVRIMYVIGYKSVGRDVDVEDVSAAGALFYTELAFIYVISICVFVLAAISGGCVVGRNEVTQGGNPEEAK